MQRGEHESQFGVDMGPTGAIGDRDYVKRMDLARSLIRRLFANAGLDAELEFVVNDGGARRRMEVHLVRADAAQQSFDGDGWCEHAEAASLAGQVVTRARAVVAQMLRERTLSMDRLADLAGDSSLGAPEVALLDTLDRFAHSTARLHVDDAEVMLCVQGHRHCSVLPREVTITAQVDHVGSSTARIYSVEVVAGASTALRLPTDCTLHLARRQYGSGVVQHALLDAAIDRRRVVMRVMLEVQMTTGTVVSLELVDFANLSTPEA